MIAKYTRKLNEHELNELNERKEEFEKGKRFIKNMFITIIVVILLTDVPLFIYYNRKDAFLWGLLVIASIIFMYGIVAKKNIKKEKEMIDEINYAIEKNIVEASRYQPAAVVKLEEIEDEGSAYIFQLDEGKMLVLQGQEFYEDERFPNTDFELATVYGKNNKPIMFNKFVFGKKLEPIKIISGKEKIKIIESDWYPIDKSEAVIDGNLNEMLQSGKI